MQVETTISAVLSKQAPNTLHN